MLKDLVKCRVEDESGHLLASMVRRCRCLGLLMAGKHTFDTRDDAATRSPRRGENRGSHDKQSARRQWKPSGWGRPGRVGVLGMASAERKDNHPVCPAGHPVWGAWHRGGGDTLGNRASLGHECAIRWTEGGPIVCGRKSWNSIFWWRWGVRTNHAGCPFLPTGSPRKRSPHLMARLGRSGPLFPSRAWRRRAQPGRRNLSTNKSHHDTQEWRRSHVLEGRSECSGWLHCILRPVIDL